MIMMIRRKSCECTLCGFTKRYRGDTIVLDPVELESSFHETLTRSDKMSKGIKKVGGFVRKLKLCNKFRYEDGLQKEDLLGKE